jgi:hypothetical protein
MTYEQFLHIVDKSYDDHSFEWRYGQTLMNVLFEIWPDKYRQLTYTYNDCFYDDRMIDKVKEKLRQEWIEFNANNSKTTL